jgi:flagella basal body P-ring formation protein FlgA
MRLTCLFFILYLSCMGGVERFVKIPTFEKFEKITSAFYSQSNRNSLVSERITGDSQEVVSLNSQELQTRLGELLKHRYQVEGDVVVSLTRTWEPLSLGHNFILKLNSCSPDELSSSSYLRFVIWDQGLNCGDFAIPVKVSHFKEVYFTDRPLSSGVRLSENLLKKCKVDVLKQHANSVQASVNLKSFETSSSIRADSPLKWSNLSKVTLINKGQIIDVFASGNGIFVTMKGLALEDGVAGSLVKVKNLSSKKEFLAKVLNESSVKVHL